MIRAYNLFLEGQDYNEELAELNYSMELRVIENKKQVEIL